MTTKKGTKWRRKNGGKRWVAVIAAGAFAITMAGAFAPRTTPPARPAVPAAVATTTGAYLVSAGTK